MKSSVPKIMPTPNKRKPPLHVSVKFTEKQYRLDNWVCSRAYADHYTSRFDRGLQLGSLSKSRVPQESSFLNHPIYDSVHGPRFFHVVHVSRRINVIYSHTRMCPCSEWPTYSASTNVLRMGQTPLTRHLTEVQRLSSRVRRLVRSCSFGERGGSPGRSSGVRR